MSAKHPLSTTSPVQKVYSGRFTGINGADPTSYKLDPGITLARSGEGVWVVTLPSPLANFKSVVCRANDSSGYHEVTWALSASARTITITHKTIAYASIASGPAAEDVVAEINFVAVVECSDCPGAGV